MNITEIKKGKILTVSKCFASSESYQIVEYKEDVLGIIKGENFIDIATYRVYPIALDREKLNPLSLYVAELEFFFPKDKEERSYILKEAEKVNEWYDETREKQKAKIIEFTVEKQKIFSKKKEKI